VLVLNTHVVSTQSSVRHAGTAHVTSRHQWGIPSVPVPIQPNLSMTTSGCGAKAKTYTMQDLHGQNFIECAELKSGEIAYLD